MGKMGKARWFYEMSCPDWWTWWGDAAMHSWTVGAPGEITLFEDYFGPHGYHQDVHLNKKEMYTLVGECKTEAELGTSCLRCEKRGISREFWK
jgi:hypothetical protein